MLYSPSNPPPECLFYKQYQCIDLFFCSLLLSIYIPFLFRNHKMSNCSSESSNLGNQYCFIQQRILEKYESVTKIGSGAYGHVWKVTCKKTKQLLAIKKVFLAFQNQTDAQRVYREVSLLLKLRHDNLIQVKQVIPSENNSDLYIIFQHLESDLFKAIKNRLLNLTHKKFIVYQLACALKYLHSAGVIHRDLKPSNVLLNSNCHIKICDLGLSRTLQSQSFINPVLTEFIATRWYRSPEVLLGSKSYSTKSDMWSLGCLIYELYSRRTLLPGENTIDQITRMIEFKGHPTASEVASFQVAKASEILSYFNVRQQPIDNYYGQLQCEDVQQILNHLLEYDQNKRWSADDLLNSQFLREFKNTLPQNASPCAILIDLNDNKRYKVDRYKSQIANMVNGSGKQLPKDMKREFLSHRKQYNSMSLHNLAKKIKAELQTTIRGKNKLDKKYQSVHNSPVKRESFDRTIRINKKGQSRLFRESNKRNMTAEFTLSCDKSIQKSKCKPTIFISKKTGTKIIRKKPHQQEKTYQDQNKQLQQNPTVLLKRTKLNCYRSKGRLC